MILAGKVPHMIGAIGLTIALIFSPSGGLAQETAIKGDAFVHGNPLPGVCMARHAATVDAEVPTREIVAAVADVRNLQMKGYAIADCPAALNNHVLVERWRDEVCRVASLTDEQDQLHFEAKWGERAAQLCGSVERVVGPWDGSVRTSEMERG